MIAFAFMGASLTITMVLDFLAVCEMLAEPQREMTEAAMLFDPAALFREIAS